MSKAVPWSIKGVDFDAREAAKEAARRDGLSLGAWMNRAIAEHAVETGADDQDFDADARLEAVAAQLARLSRESEAEGGRRAARGARGGDQETVGPEGFRQDTPGETDFGPAQGLRPAARAGQRAPDRGEAEPAFEPRRSRDPRRPERQAARQDVPQPSRSRDLVARDLPARDSMDAEALLEKAVAAFESRAEQAEGRAARALAQVAERVAERIDSAESARAEMLAQVESRLADLESHLRTKARSDVEPLHGALGRLETRLEDIARREPEPRDDETLRKLDRKLSNLISRVERADSSPAAERDEQFVRLEKRFDALLARLDRPAPPRAVSSRAGTSRVGASRAGGFAREDDRLQVIAEISARQRALDAEPLGPKPATERRPPAAPRELVELAPAFEERLDGLARKLDRIAQASQAPSEDRRIDRLQSGIEALSSRIEDMRREVSAIQGAPRDNAAPAVEAALRELAARIDALAAAQPATALKDVAGLRGELSGLNRSLGDLAPRGAVTALESAMRDLSNRVESTRSAVERAAETQTRPAPDMPDLSRQLADIARGLQDVAPRGAVAGVESAMRELVNRVDAAREIMARASERQLDSAPDFEALDRKLAEIACGLSDVAPRGAVAGLEDAVRSLTARVETARSIMERAPVGASAAEIESLSQQVAAMGRALEDVAPRSQIAALDLAVRDLGDRLERSRDEGLRDAVLAPIEQLVADVRRALAEIGASADLDGVISQMRALESKIDDLRRNGADRGDFLNACDQSDALRASIAAALEQMEPLERIEKQVAGLTDRLETLSRQSSEARSAHENGLARNEAGWRDIGSRIDELALRIDRAADQRPEPHAVEESRFEDLSRRLDFMHQALAERIDDVAAGGRGQPVPQGLEPLLRALADKLEHAMAPQADSRAIEALERQVAQVSERLERDAVNGNMQLQQALADLAARLDEGRQHDREAVREVARETLREALAHLPASDARNEQAIADLREKHENSDRRAQQTLSAVHETLEKVVDRLAMLEEDVQEARAARPSSAIEALSPQGAAFRSGVLPRVESSEDDFDPDSLLVEPGAGRPAASAPAARGNEAPALAASEEESFDAPNVRLSREDEAALMSGSRSANYIEVARRALAARAAAEAQDQAEAQRAGARGAAAAERAKEGAAKFKRPVGAAEKRGAGARTGVLLAAGASVLAMGMFQLYRVAMTPAAPPMEMAAPSRPAAMEAAPAPTPAAPVAPEAAAPAPVSPAATPAPEAPAQTPATPARGAGLTDPLAVGSIAPRTSNMAAIEAGAQAANLKQLAEKGDAAAQFDLAARYAEGRGLDRDPAAAVAWFEKAAAQGQAQAEYRLGVIYEKALGVTRDARKARDFYEKAAAQGHVRAMHNLAVIEAEGVDGKPDYAGAAQWFRRAAEYGVRDSQYNLAILYARGMGLAQNMAQSYVWFSAAASQGDEDAARKRDEVAARLSADDLAAAKKQAASFRARAANPAVNDPPTSAVRPQASAKI